MYLRALKRIQADTSEVYPYMSCLNSLDTLDLNQDVTIFIGENGTGKTTLLEAIVTMTNVVSLFPEVAGRNLGPERLAKSFQLVWNKKVSRGFYLKSQSFITYVHRLSDLKSETELALDKVMTSYQNRSAKAQRLAAMPYRTSLSEMENRYSASLETMSHGEGYMELFKSRLVPEALYILDEPELSLSPTRQLALISLIKTMVKERCQFIMITHSPILMAYENARIYEFGDDGIKTMVYDEIEHVKLTRDFLNSPGTFLKYL